MCKKPFVIGVAGAVGAGKSWFAEKLKESLSVPVCVFTLERLNHSGWNGRVICQFLSGDEIRFPQKEISVKEQNM